jgi:ABC-type methionine transport system permease subunit
MMIALPILFGFLLICGIYLGRIIMNLRRNLSRDKSIAKNILNTLKWIGYILYVAPFLILLLLIIAISSAE